MNEPLILSSGSSGGSWTRVTPTGPLDAGRGTVDMTGHHIAGQVLPFHLEADLVPTQSELGFPLTIRDHGRSLHLLAGVEIRLELDLIRPGR